jgi:hypothetical protein
MTRLGPVILRTSTGLVYPHPTSLNQPVPTLVKTEMTRVFAIFNPIQYSQCWYNRINDLS